MSYCQKCRTPLKVDSSLDDLNPAAFDLLVGSSGKSQQKGNSSSRLNYPQERKSLYDTASKNTTSSVFKRTIPAPYEDGHINSGRIPAAQSLQPDMSFIEITESQIVAPDRVQTNQELSKQNGKTDIPAKADELNGTEKSFSAQMKKNEKLFSILSSRSDIDHPICAECTALLLTSFNARLASATRERDAYASFLKSLQQSSSTANGEEDKKADKDLVDLTREDGAVYEELLKLEHERQLLERDLADLEEESQQLEIEEQAFWAQRNSFDEELYDLATNVASLQQKYGHDQQQLDRLQRTNVYNDTFCIGHDGYFGTINGLRLGRLSSQNVEWAEINAAWGQTLLLLATVAERLGFNFQGYRLRPLGSTSRIEKLEWPQQPPEAVRPGAGNRDQRLQAAATNPQPKVTQLDLFSSGEMAVGRIFNHRKFDAGMVAFLDCLAQVGDHVERTSSQADTRPTGRIPPAKRVLPYRIQGEKIGDVSIKLGVGFQQDENFTKACKYALTCCKFLLAHVSNLENPRGT